MDNYLSIQAWKFILDNNISQLPVDPFRIIEKNGWTLYTYHEFANIVHKSVSQIVLEHEKDGFVFFSKRHNGYVICINSEMPFNVCRWTLFHEIAHIYLNHVSPNTPFLSRVRTETRPIWETEAQGFARRVICPSIVLHDCRATEPEEIMQLCGISREAAEFRSKYIKVLELRNRFGLHPMELQVESQFMPFIRSYLLKKMTAISSRHNMEIAMEICA